MAIWLYNEDPRLLSTMINEKVVSTLESLVQERRLGEVNKLVMETAIAQHTEHMLREIGSITEASRYILYR